ncbi:dTDP-glucose 4,6-dehydratase [Candidatus Falkowbacteria bacterium RIFOXYC2_FULL_36_12]|uniref:dTDP-glucose 4,6-dehydratase n=1 Tax=Candidatus Falkowbacteria bacterium RIFOXYC2_FULL_36_12 TaxID=1798002 RepID=A0A1F5SW15_9BACT|nr:MAG: dTDP-glucose 4,6-dehydratase [Candidatus Falkowbacteria bacterium RIFOXYC2_FULL_36_12]
MLVTGGAGFIGTNFIKYILKKYPYYAVINYDKLTYAGNLENLKDLETHPNYSFVRGDILNTELLDYIMKGVDVVVHFAAESHVDRSIMEADVFVLTNVVGTFSVLEAAKKNNVKRFHHISTDEVFGSLGAEGLFHEDTPYDPRSPYASSKAASDHLVRAYYHTHGLPITVSNCSNNYGPYQFPEKLIPLFVTNLIEGKKVPLYGDGKNVRDWVHVSDHNEAVDLIIHEGKVGETYCIGAQSERTNRQITDLILAKMGVGEEMVEYVEDRKGHDRRYAIRPYKIMAELGWKPRVSFEEGMEQTINWYRENQDWWKKVKSGEYLEYYEKQYGRKNVVVVQKNMENNEKNSGIEI